MLKIVSLVLFSVLVAVSAGDQRSLYSIFFEEKKPEPTPECFQEFEVCAKQTWTGGRCRTTSGAVLLHYLRNDADNNCVVSGAEDFIKDGERFLDKNDDGYVCRDEWVARRTSYYNHTPEYANFEWPDITGGQECLEMATLKNIPDIGLRTTFSEDTVRRLVTFCNQGNNKETNRDCFGLPMVCKYYKEKNLRACRDLFDSNIRTLQEKIELDVRMNDVDNDGTISRQEIIDDLNQYDLDGNGLPDRREFIARWTSFYDFTAESAAYSFDQFNVNGDEYFDIRDIDAVTTDGSLPTPQLPNFIVSEITKMCEATPSLYETNKDCAMISETCRKYYPENPECAIFVNQCGGEKYRNCILNLSLRDVCQGRGNREEIRLESWRMDNQFKPECKPYNQEIACATLDKLSSFLGNWFRSYW